MTRLLPALLLGAALGCGSQPVRAQNAAVQVEMNADRKQLSMNDNVAVRIYVRTKGSGQPDIVVPDFEGFQVVQRAVQRPMQFSFGFGQAAPVVTSSTQYTFVLAPMGPGTFKIPPVRVTFGRQVYQSDPLVLTVTGQPNANTLPASGAQPNDPQAQRPDTQQQPAQQQAAPTAQASGDAAVFDREAFLRTVVDKTDPYEGEQVTATIYLYTRHNLQQVPAVQTEASTDGLWVHDLLSATRSLEPTRQVVNGRGFWVYVLRRFAAFPLRSGDLTIGSMTLTLSRDSIFDLFDSNPGPRSLKRSSVPVQLHVKPLPEDNKPTGPIAIGDFQLTTKLDRTQVVTGDAITLTATLQGKGNLTTARLPDPKVAGLQILQPEVHDLTESPGDSVHTTRTFSWLIVPNAPGKYTLPALAINTFNPATARYVAVHSQPLTLVAAGAARASAAPPPDEPAAASDTGSDEHAQATGEAPAHEEAWPPVRAHSALLRRQTPVASGTFYPLALAFWPLLWLGSWLGPSFVTRLRAAGSDSGERSALRDARRRFSQAENALAAHDAGRFHADVAAALQTALEARLGEAVSGLTHSALRSKLAQRGMPQPLSNALCDVLSQCDFARFSPAPVSDAQMQGLLAKAEHLWSDVVAFCPSPKEAS